jgi:hypothetical protein
MQIQVVNKRQRQLLDIANVIVSNAHICLVCHEHHNCAIGNILHRVVIAVLLKCIVVPVHGMVPLSAHAMSVCNGSCWLWQVEWCCNGIAAGRRLHRFIAASRHFSIRITFAGLSLGKRTKPCLAPVIQSLLLQ